MKRPEDKHLRLLPNPESEPADCRTEQLSLFPGDTARLLVFATLSVRSVSGESFTTWIEQAMPRCVIDLRVLPLFNMRGFDRMSAFELFARQRLIYRDFAGELDVWQSNDARLNPAIVAIELLKRLPATLEGPVLFLADSPTLANLYAEHVPRGEKFSGWSVRRDVSWESAYG